MKVLRFESCSLDSRPVSSLLASSFNTSGIGNPWSDTVSKVKVFRFSSFGTSTSIWSLTPSGFITILFEEVSTGNSPLTSFSITNFSETKENSYCFWVVLRLPDESNDFSLFSLSEDESRLRFNSFFSEKDRISCAP